MSMVNLQKNIQWWWSGGSKTIEKPSLAMVPWRKNITITSFEKNDHRWSLPRGMYFPIHSLLSAVYGCKANSDYSDLSCTLNTNKTHSLKTQSGGKSNFAQPHYSDKSKGCFGDEWRGKKYLTIAEEMWALSKWAASVHHQLGVYDKSFFLITIIFR